MDRLTLIGHIRYLLGWTEAANAARWPAASFAQARSVIQGDDPLEPPI